MDLKGILSRITGKKTSAERIRRPCAARLGNEFSSAFGTRFAGAYSLG